MQFVDCSTSKCVCDTTKDHPNSHFSASNGHLLPSTETRACSRGSVHQVTLHILISSIILKTLIFDFLDILQRFRDRHGAHPPALGILAPSIDFFSKRSGVWKNTGGFSDIRGEYVRERLWIEANSLFVYTGMFEVDITIEPSRGKSRAFVLQLLSNSSGWRAGIVAIKTLSQGKEHWERILHERGLFFFRWHIKDEKLCGFFAHQWPSSRTIWPSLELQHEGKYIGTHTAVFQMESEADVPGRRCN